MAQATPFDHLDQINKMSLQQALKDAAIAVAGGVHYCYSYGSNSGEWAVVVVHGWAVEQVVDLVSGLNAPNPRFGAPIPESHWQNFGNLFPEDAPRMFPGIFSSMPETTPTDTIVPSAQTYGIQVW